MKITAKRLREMYACEREVAVFEKEWPKGAKTTLKNLLRAVELGLDLGWFADVFLTSEWQKEYYKKTDSIWKECYREEAVTQEKYNEKRARVLFDILKRK